MKETTNYHLRKPDPEDFYNIEDFNHNADLLDAALKAMDNGKLDKSGGTMTGDLTLNGDPTSNLMAATKKYVDDTAGAAKGKRTCRFVVGTSTAGWTSKDCDYLCDGTDDQDDIRIAIDNLPPTGGEVVILDGTYNFTRPLYVYKKNTTITGNGGGTVLKSSINGFAVIELNADFCNVQNLHIDGGSIINNSHGVYVKSKGNVVSGVICENIRDGIYILNEGNIIQLNETFNSGTGIAVCGSKNNIVLGNYCHNNESGISVHINSSTNIRPAYNLICNNQCTDNIRGISQTSADKTVISNNICYRGNGTSSDYTLSQYTIVVDGSNNLITDNLIMGKNYYNTGTNNTFVNNKYN